MEFFIEIIKNYSSGVLVYTFYLLLINVLTFIIMGIDKRKAMKNQWRVKEFTFMVLALLGGAIGIILAMVIFHHKNSKKKFYYGIPILYIMNKIISVILYNYLF
ncbi:MAG: DUF1294 domain-containing protein [Clostridiaceae bacterium]|nr:DUF1294 domain-containing protein [Clostridiaceae bacterium]